MLCFGLTLGAFAFHEALETTTEYMPSALEVTYSTEPIEDIPKETQLKLMAVSVLGGLSVGGSILVASTIESPMTATKKVA